MFYLPIYLLTSTMVLRRWIQRMFDKEPPVGFRLAPLALNLDDLEQSWITVAGIWSQNAYAIIGNQNMVATFGLH